MVTEADELIKQSELKKQQRLEELKKKNEEALLKKKQRDEERQKRDEESRLKIKEVLK